jgi:hypothetical protein
VSALIVRPITIKQANSFVFDHHRHSRPVVGGKWAIALMRGDELVGVAISGRPVSRVLQQRGYMEINRVCVIEGVEGGCSMLYRRCRRIGQLMGYERFVSYNLETESGASLRAAGFEAVAKVRGRQHDTPSRRRVIKTNISDMTRWEAS